MIKKTLLVSALALMASGAALANGFYVGGGLGAMDFNNKNTATGSFSSNEDFLTANGSASSDAGSVGLNTTLLAGYAWNFPNKLFVGLEAFGDYTTAKVKADTNFTAATQMPTGLLGMSASSLDMSAAATTEMKINYVYGVRVLPGYLVTADTVAYGILGYARANTRLTSTSTVDMLGSTGTTSASDYYNFDGMQLGFGSMTEIAKNVSLRGDVIYTAYKSKTIEDTITTGAGTATGSMKMQMSTLEGNVALVYKFG